MANSKMRRIGRYAEWTAALALLMACAANQPSDSDGADQAEGAQVPCKGIVQDDVVQHDGLCSSLGGQSGTEGGSEIACVDAHTDSVTLDAALEPLGGSLRDLAASIGAPVTPGRWLATAERNELTFELGPLESALETSTFGGGWLCDWALDVQSVTLRTSDGAVDQTLLGHIRRPDPNSPHTVVLDVELSALPQAQLAPAVWPYDVPLAQQWVSAHAITPRETGGPTLVIVVELAGPDPVIRAASFQSGTLLGIWDTDVNALPVGPPLPYTPSEPLASACRGAEQFQTEATEYTSFPDAAAALEGVTGTWARCLDNANAEQVGLRIQPDGSWQHLGLESGELVALSGFGHEGFVQLIDTSQMNSKGGLFQLDLWPLARQNGAGSQLNDRSTHASERALVFGSSNQGWPAAVYLPTALAVRGEAPSYADGERAGAAACAQGESGIVASAEENAAALTGDYVLCSGSLPGDVATIRFGESSLELLRADGSLVAAPSYSVDSSYAAGGASVMIGGGDDYRYWSVIASRHPRKLWIQQARDYGSDSAVFSAVP